MSKFRYQPQIQDVLRKQMPHSVVEQLLRRDHSLEDYLDALPAPSTGGGALAGLTDHYSGLVPAPIASDPTLSGAVVVNWVPGVSVAGAVTTPDNLSFAAPVAGLYLVGLNVGFEANAAGFRLAGFGAVDYSVYQIVPAFIPPAGAYMPVNTYSSMWLEAGDTIYPSVAQNSGIALDVLASIDITQVATA